MIWLCRASGRAESSSASDTPSISGICASSRISGQGGPSAARRSASPALSTQLGISPIWRSMVSSRRRLVLLSSTTSTRWLLKRPGGALPEAVAFRPSSGRVKANSLPAPGWLSTISSPPIRLARRAEMVNPSPVPP